MPEYLTTLSGEPGFLVRVSRVESVVFMSALPSLASNEVTDVGPLDIVLSGSTVVVGDLTLVVGPE